jgi:hypothetical protein
MKERPILFSAQMVRAILNGTNTQTRRIIKPQPKGLELDKNVQGKYGHLIYNCKYGSIGDRLWVREKFQFINGFGDFDFAVHYIATEDIIGWFENEGRVQKPVNERIRPSIHMPRWASRINLEITNVRAELLHDISEEDAKAEGAKKTFWFAPDGKSEDDYISFCGITKTCYKNGYASFWESINGQGSWDANPYVLVIEFKRII